MRDPSLVTGGYYHVFNRGVDKRPIFVDSRDYGRFIESLHLFNDQEYQSVGGDVRSKMRKLARAETGFDRRIPIVRIIAYCLLPNHFHLFLEQLVEGGISTFLHRFGGYARYFNLKHERSGGLLEKSFEAVHVKEEFHFTHLPRYIHLNALDLTDLNWRDGEICDWEKAAHFLDAYPWSSHHTYLGLTQELPIVDEVFLRQLFPTRGDYEAFLRGWSGRNTPWLSHGV